MKSVTLSLLLFTNILHATAQGVFSNQTNAALQKVIGDYPNRFNNIKGDRLQQHERSTEYRSKVEVPGSINCVIRENNSKPEAVFSWTCEMFGSPNFDKAKTKFQELYNQIRNTIIKIEGEKPVILNGQYEEPTSDNQPTTIRFQFLPASEAIQQLKVELVLQYGNEWTISLCVYDQEKQYAAIAR